MNETQSYRNTWYMKTKAGALYRKLSGQIATAYDTIIDLRICGKPLGKYVPSIDRKIKQATGSESARYWTLEKVFRDVNFSPDDKLIDVGCGKGRVLAFLEKNKFPGQLYGIELNPIVAEYAQSWANKYNNINIFSGDAFGINYDDYTVIMMCRPFLEDMYLTFLDKLEADVTHPITVILYVDNYMAKHVADRSGWSMIKKDCEFKKGIIAPNYYPVHYSIWNYNPVE